MDMNGRLFYSAPDSTATAPMSEIRIAELPDTDAEQAGTSAKPRYDLDQGDRLDGAKPPSVA
jgi:hypothetical protein